MNDEKSYISIVSFQPQKHDNFLNIISTAHKSNKPERDVHCEEGLGVDYEKRRKQKQSVLNVKEKGSFQLISNQTLKGLKGVCSNIHRLYL